MFVDGVQFKHLCIIRSPFSPVSKLGSSGAILVTWFLTILSEAFIARVVRATDLQSFRTFAGGLFPDGDITVE